MKTIKQLSELDGRVYVYLSADRLCDLFLRRAEDEGFRFCDGEKPTRKRKDCIYAVNKDMTLNYVGFAGHAAYGSGCERIGAQRLIRVDYGTYIGE
ncbi:MAG: hypothetical protein IJG45_03340 [Oscillospiraceae bacterium]|nr:hypothetical protein [Oscillospiraceae bacterium]